MIHLGTYRACQVSEPTTSYSALGPLMGRVFDSDAVPLCGTGTKQRPPTLDLAPATAFSCFSLEANSDPGREEPERPQGPPSRQHHAI